MDAITLQNVTKHLGDFVLDLSLSVPQGSIVGLIGANGAGKTTTMKLILDMLQPDSGSIAVLGEDKCTPQKREEIGVVFDECYFPEDMNATQIGKMFAGIYQHFNVEKYHAYLDKFKLPRGKKAIKEYSRGMRMKLSLAVAFSHGAKLLLLDEPTGGLDPLVRNEILDLLWDFIQDENCSILLSSHITSDLEKIADYIAFLDDGRMKLFGEKDQLLSQYTMVRGGTELLSKIPSQYLVGVKKNSFGFEALTHETALREAYPELLFAPATLEDIFLSLTQQSEV